MAVADAVRAQFNDRGGIEVFGKLHRLRRRRNSTEYPDDDAPSVTSEDARQALETGREVLDAARKLVASGRVGPLI